MFKIGDRVWSLNFGWGEVKEIRNDIKCGLFVVFNSGYTYWFTLDGKLLAGCLKRDLFFEEFEIPRTALERPRKSAKEMLDECKEVEFKYGKDNVYICYSHINKTFYTSFSAFIEILGIKYISVEDAERIIADCKENNRGEK